MKLANNETRGEAVDIGPGNGSSRIPEKEDVLTLLLQYGTMEYERFRELLEEESE